ncbi:hypothetical protein QOZ80_5AG0399170 [Eleusine coracana subsp. coracana]|nr:hypothetical protein QOZ80_5AG0399170 [Eleusine coracana subsp. coracana]
MSRSTSGDDAPEHTDVEIWDELELIAALRKFLFEKRYFIVIDDIWDASAWDIIRCALPENRKVPASSCQLQRFRAPGFLRVPKWIGQLHNLYDLKLIVKEVLEDDIEILSQLPSLTYLVLIFKEAPEHKIVIGESGFLVLKHLKVVCNKISFLTFEAGAMTKLEGLKLCFNAHGWDRHGAAPAGMEYLSGLKVIFVDIGGRHAKESNIRAARSALRNAIDMHPGRPAAKIKCHDDETFGFDEVDEECDDSCC